jgi:hypothetical protein
MMRVQVLIKGRIPCIVSIREIPCNQVVTAFTNHTSQVLLVA